MKYYNYESSDKISLDYYFNVKFSYDGMFAISQSTNNK
jgi:hypothetical protein